MASPPRQLSVCVLLAVAMTTVFSQSQPTPYSVNEGEQLTLPCGDATAKFFMWRRNGVKIDGAEDHSLIIPNASHSLHAGTYTCTAVLVNMSQSAVFEFIVSVYYIDPIPPTLHRTYPQCVPLIGRAYLGGSLTLECIPPDGEPMVNVTWYRYDQKIRQRDDPTVDFSNRRRMMKISPIAFAHIGDYHCEAANTVNKENPFRSEILDVTVEEASHEDVSISITDEGEDLIVGRGLNATIVCRIVPAVERDSVHWFHDNALLDPLDPHDNLLFEQGLDELNCLNSLNVTNVMARDAGIYECRHDDTANLHAQRSLLLASLSGPLVVEATPTNLVAPGQELRLTCQLSDDASPARNNVPPQNFTWTHNGSTELTHAMVVEGGRELVISTTELEASGHYECAVSSPPDVITPISASLNITVEASPAVSISLCESESVYDYTEGDVAYVQLGAGVTLDCAIASPRTPHFTWYQGDDVISNHSSGTLTLPHLTPSHLTYYHCQINDSVHVLLTERLYLNETPKPYIKEAAAGIQGAEFANGTALHLECEVRGGSTEGVRWYEGDVQLPSEGGGVRVVSNGSISILIKQGVTASDAGRYGCVLGDSGMESRRTFDVVITVPAKLENSSDTYVTVTTGGRVQFDCVTSGIPPPTVKWLYNSVVVMEDSVVMDIGNGSLLILSVSLNHAGSYYCYILDGDILKEFTLIVEADDNGLQCGGDFGNGDCITLLSGGAVAIIFLLLAFVVLLCCVCVMCHRWRKGSLNVARDLDVLRYERNLSSRASIQKDNGAAPSVDNKYASNEYCKGLYPTNLHLTPYDGTVLSELRRSVTPPAPSPVLHTPGTGATNSMFSTDDQSSLTASLPNFPRTQLQLGEELGEGEFGPVVVGMAHDIISHEAVTQVVVKVLVRSEDGDDQFQPDLALVDFANQMKIEYEHIACILGLCTDTEPYYVIYEYLDQGDLKKYLLSHRPIPGQPSSLTPHTLSRLVLQVADGMAFLFSQRIIHGDLATRNCLISSDHRLKIADLGIGHDLYQTDYYDNGSQLLPIRWMPPELLVAEEAPAFSLHSDIWSFGVLCWEVFMFGELPYEGLADEEVLERVPRGARLAPPTEGCPSHVRAVMVRCWQVNPESRPSFSSLCMDMNIIGE